MEQILTYAVFALGAMGVWFLLDLIIREKPFLFRILIGCAVVFGACYLFSEVMAMPGNLIFIGLVSAVIYYLSRR